MANPYASTYGDTSFGQPTPPARFSASTGGTSLTPWQMARYYANPNPASLSAAIGFPSQEESGALLGHSQMPAWHAGVMDPVHQETDRIRQSYARTRQLASQPAAPWVAHNPNMDAGQIQTAMDQRHATLTGQQQPALLSQNLGEPAPAAPAANVRVGVRGPAPAAHIGIPPVAAQGAMRPDPDKAPEAPAFPTLRAPSVAGDVPSRGQFLGATPAPQPPALLAEDHPFQPAPARTVTPKAGRTLAANLGGLPANVRIGVQGPAPAPNVGIPPANLQAQAEADIARRLGPAAALQFRHENQQQQAATAFHQAQMASLQAGESRATEQAKLENQMRQVQIANAQGARQEGDLGRLVGLIGNGFDPAKAQEVLSGARAAVSGAPGQILDPGHNAVIESLFGDGDDIGQTYKRFQEAGIPGATDPHSPAAKAFARQAQKTLGGSLSSALAPMAPPTHEYQNLPSWGKSLANFFGAPWHGFQVVDPNEYAASHNAARDFYYQAMGGAAPTPPPAREHSELAQMGSSLWSALRGALGSAPNTIGFGL